MSQFSKHFLTIVVGIAVFCALLVQANPELERDATRERTRAAALEKLTSFTSYDLNRTRQRQLMAIVLAAAPEVEQILNGRAGTSSLQDAAHQAERTTGVHAQAVALINRAGESVALHDPRVVLPPELGSLAEVRGVMSGGGTDGGLHVDDGIALFTATSPVRSSQDQIIGAILVVEILDEAALQEWRGEVGADLIVFQDGRALASTLQEGDASAPSENLLVRVSANPGEFFGGEHRPGPIVVDEVESGSLAMVAARFRDPFDGLPADELGVLLVTQEAPSEGGVFASLRAAHSANGGRTLLFLGIGLVALFLGWFLIDLDTRRRGPALAVEATAASEDLPAANPPSERTPPIGDAAPKHKPDRLQMDQLQIPTRPKVVSPSLDGEAQNVQRHAESNEEIEAVLRPERAAELSAEVEAVLRADEELYIEPEPDSDDVSEEVAVEAEDEAAKVLRPKKKAPDSPAETEAPPTEGTSEDPWGTSKQDATTRPTSPPVNEVERVFSPWAESEEDSDHKSPPRGTSPSLLSPPPETGTHDVPADPRQTITADEMAMIDDSGLYRSSMIPNALKSIEPMQPGWQDASVSDRPNMSGEGTEQIAWKNLEAALELPDPVSEDPDGEELELEPESGPEEEVLPLFESADDAPYSHESAAVYNVEEEPPFAADDEVPLKDDDDLDAEEAEEDVEPPASTPIGGYPSLENDDQHGIWKNPAKRGARGTELDRPEPSGLTEPTPASLSEALNEQEPFYNLFCEFVDTRERCGESISKVSFDSFRRKLEKTEAAVKNQFGCPDVRFEIYVKSNRAAIKATPIH